ncbi:MAG TPA: prolyl oligopeptidase family serine peptidase [Bryobacteraceae bacterium]|nr:prolyl oligopeptidase family serine peptidase [Bryobacteraceae bacterium]
MKYTVCPLLVLAVGASAADQKLNYPKTRTVDQTDSYHGTQVPDPYRWLEDDNSADTKAWVEAQNALTMPYLASIPERNAIRDRMKSLTNYERFGVPVKRGGRYFFTRNDGLQERSVLYVSKSLTDPGEVLIDPNKFPDKSVALAGTYFSPNGKILAYALATAGSDWNEIRFMDVESKKTLDDHVQWVKFSGAAWTEDNAGVYYSRYEQPKGGITERGLNYNQKVYYHKLGTPQSEDKLIYERPDQREWMFDAASTEDARYVVLTISRGTEPKNAFFYRAAATGKWIELLKNWDAEYHFLGNRGTSFYFQTDNDAPNGRIIAIDLDKPGKENWKTVVPEAKEALSSSSYLNRRFVLSYLKDGRSDVRLFEESGKSAGVVSLPGIGKAGGFGGREDDTETFYFFTSYTVPTTIYKLDLKTNGSSVFKQPKVPIDLGPYETKLVFYNSKDGTRVPMFLTHRKDIKMDGNNPVFLYGYGGFSIPVTVAYSPMFVTWLEMGGVLAFPALRGGSEYGREWHLAGTKHRKQNVFDDFIGAAEYLVAQKYTNPKKIGIHGGSNGGLLVAATVLQRPDLFGAAVPAVGVLDMLRFHKFTIGWAWVSDYGSADNPEDYKALRAYSPLHNVKLGMQYPPTLITTADHDDRVVPGHSFKFAAAMQAAQEGKAPILLRVETKAGHGAGRRLSAQIEEQSDILAFLVKNLEVKTSYAGSDAKSGN